MVILDAQRNRHPKELPFKQIRLAKIIIQSLEGDISKSLQQIE